ncbi:histidine phosphatase family protein [Viridibacillus sp. YIM B01967]|uniref:Histidine phosphatase family protein n=1 Tax=Viridibacillus soli TaxID=2798301 RepID=A0ABS1H5B8_9BACL|nr:histidine phosphatase family protein [Viridibacillus soli]MBK3494617.1 histidine phosphatase family protein [Viridibacillus soli]
MKKIYIIRHCKAAGQEREAMLTVEGIEQAKQLAESLQQYEIKRIISSPFTRAIQTIEPFAKKAQIDIERDERLAERILSTQNIDDWLEKLQQTFLDMDVKYEGGESSKEATERINQLIEELFEASVEDAAIISHGNLLSLLITKYNSGFGFSGWQAMKNPDVFLLTKDGQDITIKRIDM